MRQVRKPQNKMLKYLILVFVMALLAVAGIVRVRPIPPEDYHVDPATLMRANEPGHFAVGDGGDLPPQSYDLSLAELAQRLKSKIEATPRTTLLSGDLAQGHATYVTRSAAFGFPDITTIKLVEVDGKTSLTGLARLIYGKYDLGANEARMRSWIEAL